MKRGVLNYSMTWNQCDEKHEELYFTKVSMIKAYTEMITRHWDRPFHDDGVSSLTLWEIRKTGDPKNITGEVNNFLYH